MLPENTLKRYVDLHIHTKFSDGGCSLEEVMGAAAAKGLVAVSITDHDCTDAYPAALGMGEAMGIEVVPGVELSSEIEGVDIHVLGYYVDFNNPAFMAKLREMKEARYERARKIVSNLNRDGIDLRFDTVLAIAGEGAIGRPHIAAAMLKEELVFSFREAFDRYIGYDSPFYVEKLKMSPKDVFALIRNAGGVPVLAHPGVTRVDERIPEFIRNGLQGIETIHIEHPDTAARHYLRLCEKHGLAFTGGSDFHGNNQRKHDLGHPRVPYAAIESLKKKIEDNAK
ncbi:MAG: PHP domain-containing protein [Chitinispirillales bacterium]|jgi:predicted metal-dependent phosphoesterase TrpH|nr:PHP domain-containing protein [Chitinispirillales bacterium]